MPRDTGRQADHITASHPEWETFRVGRYAINHLTVGRYAGMRVALCGMHLETRRLRPLELAPDAARCFACERRLQPGGPELLTPDNWRRIALAELQLDPLPFMGTPQLYVEEFIKRTVHNWERILLAAKGDPP